MDSETAIDTGRQLFTWLDEYGALRCWAVYGMLSTLAWPLLIIYAIRRLGRPIAKIADCLEKAVVPKT